MQGKVNKFGYTWRYSMVLLAGVIIGVVIVAVVVAGIVTAISAAAKDSLSDE